MSIIKDSGERTRFYDANGKEMGQRDMHEGKGRFDLLPMCVLMRLARHYEAGSRKYSERNWEKGIPLHCYIDSGVRHYLKFLRGDTDEPHDRAFVWNMLGAIWTHLHRPGCIDLPFAQEEKAQCK